MLATLVACGLMALRPPVDLPRNGVRSFALDDPNTEKNHTYIDFAWSYKDVGEGEDALNYCSNDCQGKKHFAHESCDSTCDKPCTKGIHELSYNTYYGQEEHKEEVGRDVQAEIRKFGITTDIRDGFLDVVRAMDDAAYDTKYDFKERIRCWNKEPCSDAWKGYKTRKVYGVLSYQVYRLEKGANGKEVRVGGPKKSANLVRYYFVDKDSPISYSHVLCKCSIVGATKPIDEHSSTGGVYKDGHFATATETSQDMLRVVFGDMNSFSVSATNMTMRPITYEIFPGTICYPADSMFQTMMTTEMIKLVVPPMQTASVQAPVGDSPPLSFASQKGAAVCLNMHKKEPDETVQYEPLNCNDDRLLNLAKFAAEETNRGSWTQSRIWILTDNATLGEIQKILNPGPSEGHYLRSLYQVATVAHIDFTEKDRRRCLDPQLITGASATAEGTDWFVKTMEKVDPKALNQFILESPGSFQNLFVARAGTLGMEHAVDVANALLRSSNADLRNAGMQYLQHSIPKEKFDGFVAAGGLSGLNSALDSDDPVTAAAAMDTAETMPYKALTLGLYNLSKNTSADLKARAANLLKNLRD